MKNSFEDRLDVLAGAAGVKAAKQLLKNHRLTGAWRDSGGTMHGRFAGSAGAVDVSVPPGETGEFSCTCGAERFCEHAAALVMYCGRFNSGFLEARLREDPPSYYGGLRQESLPRLLERAKPATASLFISTASNFPHVPSKWENVVLNVRMRTAGREYLGNLNNLRQLYFDKSLSVVLRLENFSLHEQQIIRFLAINGEVENSQIQLNAELTAEFFHCLVGYPNFFRDGRQLTIRGEQAEAVLLRTGRKLSPGIRVGGAVLPVAGAKVIAGRAGCWVGRDGEYFFVRANCEIGFLRNFFRSGIQAPPAGSTPEELAARLPFPVVAADSLEVEERSASVMLDANPAASDPLELNFNYLYRSPDGAVMTAPRSGDLVREQNRFWKRDIAFERRFEQSLEMFGFTIEGGRAVLPGGADAAGLFLDRCLPAWLRDHPDWTLSGALASGLDGAAGLPKLKLSCRLAAAESEAFLVGYELTLRGIPVEWHLAVDRTAARSEYLAVPGVGRGVLPPELAEFFRRAEGAVRNLDPVKNLFEVPFCNAAYFTELVREIPGALVPEIAAGPRPAARTDSPLKFAFTGELRAYQRDGVAFLQWMTDRGLNPLLADEMGLGKTIQLLALLASRLRRGDPPALIVCPASLVTNWERETLRFVPGMRVAVPQGSERDDVWKNLEAYDLVILSYAAARLSNPVLRRLKFSFIVLDEAQHIKNPGSTNAKSCKNLRADHRIVLSGTPLENAPEDLWSIMDFLQPGMLGSLPVFRKTYAGAAADPGLQTDLARRVGPFIKRRTKSEVAADLPPRSERILYCTMNDSQRALYEEIRSEGLERLSRFAAGDTGAAAEIFTTLLRLRQVCCHPALLPDHRGDAVPSAKTELLLELLHENVDSSHKMLLFSQFTSMLQRLIPELDAAGLPFEYLDGATRNRQQHVDRFNRTPEIPVFLLSLKAGGTGLNLTSADTVIIYDPWWNPAVELQAAGRSHRIGQTRAVNTYKLVVKNSIEEKILDLQDQKRRLFDKVIDHPADGGFSLEELKFLLE